MSFKKIIIYTLGVASIPEAVFDASKCKDTLFSGKDDGATAYKCSQSLFKCDMLFNADPSARPLG